MDTKRLRVIIEEADFSTFKYSGRFMYGRECLAFKTPAPIEATAHIIANTDDPIERRDAAAIFHYAQVDSLGQEQVVYFPTMKV